MRARRSRLSAGTGLSGTALFSIIWAAGQLFWAEPKYETKPNLTTPMESAVLGGATCGLVSVLRCPVLFQTAQAGSNCYRGFMVGMNHAATNRLLLQVERSLLIQTHLRVLLNRASARLTGLRAELRTLRARRTCASAKKQRA